MSTFGAAWHLESCNLSKTWTSAADLRDQLERLWNEGKLLHELLGESSIFPYRFRLRTPTARQLNESFEEVRDWVADIRQLPEQYRQIWRMVNLRIRGRNPVLDEVWIDNLADALELIGRQRDAQRFLQLSELCLARFPELRPWWLSQPLLALQQDRHWPALLSVLNWFQANPTSGLYRRQLCIPGVHSKFIEQRRGLLAALLDLVLDDAVADTSVRGTANFDRRYGLREKPPRIRLRLLDPALGSGLLTDLEAPLAEISQLRLPLRQVFITENEVNFLAFPAWPASAVLFGKGYALNILAELPWLRDLPLYYWGDLDTQGFSILNRLRAQLPNVRSLLMDRATLLAHHELWGEEEKEKRSLKPLYHLLSDEQELYDDLRFDRIASPTHPDLPRHALRLEQEHLAFDWLQRALNEIAP